MDHIETAIGKGVITRRQALLVLGTGAASALAAVRGNARAAAPAKKVVRLATMFPQTKGSGYTSAVEFSKWIDAKTKGELTVQVYVGGQLGAERDLVESVQMGAVEIAYFSLWPISNIAGEWAGVLSVPYLFRDINHFRKVLDGPVGKPMRDAMLERKGIRHITFTNRGPRYLTSNWPVTTPADLKNVKMRVPESNVYIASWKMLGATVVPMAMTEIFLALRQGTINAQESNYEIIFNNSFFEVQKYLNRTAHVLDAYHIAVSEKWWRTLSPDLQKTLTEGLIEMGKLQDKLQAEDEASYEPRLKEKGMTFHEVNLQSFRDGLKDLPSQFAGKWKAGFYEEVQAVK